jgi:tyrosyl-tRNA synthetase
MFAREFLPKVGYDKRIHLMNPLIPGLGESGKMSSSEPNSKIDFEDDDAKVKSKINKAYCVDGVVEGNGLLAIMKYIIFKQLQREKREFIVERPEKYGGNISFSDYDELEKAFEEKKLSSIDLKGALASELIKFISPIREKLEYKKDLIKKAYPEK